MLEKELTGYINPGVCLIFALLKVIDFFFASCCFALKHNIMQNAFRKFSLHS